jgi:hypothetical protein
MQQMSLRQYIDELGREGYTVRDDHGEDPILIGPDGSAVETWRDNYPYDKLMSRNDYEVEKYLLQIELLKFQYWVQDTARKHVIVFEGRDAAGKGGTIKMARIEALRLFLSLVDYDGKDEQVVLQPDAKLVRRGRDAVGD